MSAISHHAVACTPIRSAAIMNVYPTAMVNAACVVYPTFSPLEGSSQAMLESLGSGCSISYNMPINAFANSAFETCAGTWMRGAYPGESDSSSVSRQSARDRIVSRHRNRMAVLRQRMLRDGARVCFDPMHAAFHVDTVADKYARYGDDEDWLDAGV